MEEIKAKVQELVALIEGHVCQLSEPVTPVEPEAPVEPADTPAEAPVV